ncbi:ankyrin repeat domain-containing protein 26-like isoform X1 [Canis lupus baileyi]|uniref:ankyrin repeat domain-containing protein 26-like isoform X1 n=1 Tax=Canis lupus baileyi TaxID=143281 RepID=UPI003B97B872
MKKRSTARNGWGLLRFGFNLRPLRVRSPPMTMTVDSFHSPGPGYHIRYQDLRGIHRAVIEGDTEKMQEIQQLLVFGLHDLNKRDRKNRTALHLACAIGSVDMVKILVLSQCQLNLRDGENRTALVKAVQCQEEACVDILLRKGADVNTKDFKDNTALHYAAYEGNISIARKLLLNKGDIEAKNKDGLTPLLLAINEKKEKMVAFLVEKANINAVDYAKRSCLHLACANGHEDMVKLLVDRKCQLNLRDVENTTALLKAVQSQDEACVDILLKHGANPDLKDIKGNTALHYAALGDNVTIAQKLLLKKVNMEIRNKDGLTPLLLAINEKKEKMVAFLVEKANINAVDYAKRTALHLACAIGREDMVKLLVDRHCQLNLCDGEDRTALVKAIQCQEEACVTILLEHGADPKVKDNKGNTALHYAAHEGIVSIAEKLLLQNANIEAKNTDGLTPVLVALNENKEQMVKFLVGKGARLLSGDTVKSSDQLISEHEEEMKPENSSQNHDLVAKKSEEVSLSSRTCKADTDDSRPSKHEDLSSGTKTVPKLNLRKQMAAFLRPKKAKCGLVSQEDRPLFADNNFAREDKTETLCKPSVNVSDYSPLAFVSPETPQTSSAMLGVTKTGKERKQHTSNKMEGAENIYDAAAAAAAAPALGTALAVAAAAAAAAPAAGLIQQRKTGKTDNHLFPTTQNEDSDSNDPGLSIMEIKKDKNVKWASKASVITPGFEEADSLTGSLLRVSNDNSLSKMDQDERRPAKKTSKEKNKVKKQVNSAEHLDDEHLDDLTQSSETASEDCKLQYSDYKSSLLLIELGMDCKDSVSVLTIQNAILKYKRSIELKRKDCEQLTRKILQVEYKVNGLEQLLSETKEMKSQLEHQKVEWERELYSLRLTLKQEKEKRRSAEILYINIKEQLRSKEELSEVSPPHEKEKGLLHENRMLQDELAMLRLEIDTIRNQKQEKRYCEDTETEKEKNDSLQNAIKLNEVTLTNTVFQSSGQLNVVTTENTMLNSKLQDEKLNRERLEAKLQSYRARVATAIQDRDQSQASKRDLELAFQRAKDEWCHLQDKMNFEMSNLKDNNEVLSQQLSEVESKLNALEIELQYTRDALREKTLALEHLQRNPKQTQGQKKEIEQKSQNEQGKVNEYMGKHESLEEKLSQLQSENMLLREQLDDAYSRVECKEKTIIYLKDQVQVIVRMVRVAGEKRALQLRERNKELINKCKQIMERAFRYEDEKEERERQEAKELQTNVVRCIQKFRDDIKKLEVENAELKVTVKEQAGQIEQLQKDLLSSSSCGDEKENLKKCMELKQPLQFRLDQEVKKNEELEKENTGLKNHLINMLRRILSKYENGELPFYGDLKTSQTEMEIQINMLRQKIGDLRARLETESSRCIDLDAKNQVLQQELLSMKATERECEKLKQIKKNLEEKVVNLRSHAEVNVVQGIQVEKYYKWEIDQRVRLIVEERLKEVNLFFQRQAASQENLEQLRASHDASIRSQVALRIKELESELQSQIRNSQELKIELEKYRQLYLEESEMRMSLTKKLSKTNERLADITTKYLVERQQNRPFHSTLTMGPVLEGPSVGNLTSSLLLDRNVTPRENVMIPTSRPQTSVSSIETHLFKWLHKPALPPTVEKDSPFSTSSPTSAIS